MDAPYATTRSTVHGVNGAVATSHPLASLTAIDVLRSGGNAVDAAIAASAVLCVVEPMMTGIGGDCFALYAPKGGPTLYGLNGSGRAPKALDAAHLIKEGHDHVPPHSVHAVTVPGAVNAWARLMETHGRLGLDRVLAPAIAIAENGFVVTPRVAAAWRDAEPMLQENEAAARHWLKNGAAPRTGETFRAPGLAKALRLIAQKGQDAFYRGRLAEECVAALKAAGGTHEAEDFAETRASEVTPIATDYRGLRVHELPPNGQGLTALILLNIFERFDLGRTGSLSADRIHLQIEAQKLAYHLRDKYVADPDTAEIPVEELLHKKTAQGLATAIDIKRAATTVPSLAIKTSDTVYLTVVDRDGNAMSFINSLYMPFGSGISTPDTGIVFQNRGACFVLDKGHLNRLAGGKRPLHTIIPGLVTASNGPHQGKVALSFGVMGGDYQPTGHAHVLSNLIDYGMDLQAAIDLPRSFLSGGRVECEHGVPDETIFALAERGHSVSTIEGAWGGGQAIAVDWQAGTLSAASDPRKDGCALAY